MRRIRVEEMICFMKIVWMMVSSKIEVNWIQLFLRQSFNADYRWGWTEEGRRSSTIIDIWWLKEKLRVKENGSKNTEEKRKRRRYREKEIYELRKRIEWERGRVRYVNKYSEEKKILKRQNEFCPYQKFNLSVKWHIRILYLI